MYSSYSLVTAGTPSGGIVIGSNLQFRIWNSNVDPTQDPKQYVAAVDDNTSNIMTVDNAGLRIFGNVRNDVLTASRVLVTDGNKQIVSSQVTSTELSYLSGVTSSIQEQINTLETNILSSNIESSNILTSNLTVVGPSAFTGHIYPGACNVYDLGSSSLRWRDLYLSGTSLNLGGLQLKRKVTTNGLEVTDELNAVSDITVRDVLATNNVGVGTTIPFAKLHVVGNSLVSGSIGIGTTAALSTLHVAGNSFIDGSIGIGTAVALSPLHVVGNSFVNGSIGIGTSSPLAPLHVMGRAFIMSGSVGIGTTQPISTFQVAGSGRFTGGVVANGVAINGQNLLLKGQGEDTNHGLNYDSTFMDGPRLYGNSGGSLGVVGGIYSLAWRGANVGIGTRNPSVALDVIGNVRASGLTASRAIVTDINDMLVSSTVTTTELEYLSGVTSSVQSQINGKLSLGGGNVTGNVNVSGNFYAANITTSNLLVFGDTTIMNTISSNTDKIEIVNAGTGPALTVTQTGTNTVAAFYDAEVVEPALLIADTGNVGIRIATPMSDLHVNGGVIVSSNIGIGTNNPQATIHSAKDIFAAANSAVWNNQATKGLFMRYSTYSSEDAGYVQSVDRSTNTWYDLQLQGGNISLGNSTAHVHIKSDGKVGIGTNAPSYRLHAVGDIFATGSIIAHSDARVKDNIRPIESALEKVCALNGYTYTQRMVEEDDSKQLMGVLAQEVEKIVPEVVYTKNDGYKGVAYGNMVALLIEAIKELKEMRTCRCCER